MNIYGRFVLKNQHLFNTLTNRPNACINAKREKKLRIFPTLSARLVFTLTFPQLLF